MNKFLPFLEPCWGMQIRQTCHFWGPWRFYTRMFQDSFARYDDNKKTAWNFFTEKCWPKYSILSKLGYVSKAEELKGKGVSQIFCVAVNDPFVMAAWGENQVNLNINLASIIQHSVNEFSHQYSISMLILQNAGGKVRLLADTCGDFTKALDLELDLAKVLGNVRCKVH